MHEHEREVGRLITWIDPRGFGFIRRDDDRDGDRDCFVALRTFPPGTVPWPGMRLTFTRGLAKDGRVRASSVEVLPEEGNR